MRKLTAKLRRRQLDESLNKLKGVVMPRSGYIREIRNALEMSSYQLAKRIGVSQSSAMQMEENERNSTITLQSLERAAEALECKLVYALVPKASLEGMVKEQAKKQANKLSKAIFQTMALEDQSTNKKDQEEIIEELMMDILRKGKRELWKDDK